MRRNVSLFPSYLKSVLSWKYSTKESVPPEQGVSENILCYNRKEIVFIVRTATAIASHLLPMGASILGDFGICLMQQRKPQQCGQ